MQALRELERKTHLHHLDLWLANIKVTRLLAKDQHALWRKGLLPGQGFDTSRFVLFYIGFWILTVLGGLILAVCMGMLSWLGN
jgi:hypothetical protein